jgi:ATP synthase protein I
MNDPSKRPSPPQPELAEKVGAKAVRKLRARRHGSAGIWFGLGMMGLIGWSVAIPTLLGAALGLWLDHHYPIGRSWTLALLIAGLAIGCFNAWRWISREDQAIREEQEADDE